MKSGPTGVGQQVRSLIQQNVSYREIERRLGVRRSTISYHARQMDKPKKLVPQYDWKVVQAYYDEHTYRETLDYFGMSKSSISKAFDTGKLIWKDHRISLDELLVDDRPNTSRSHLKTRLINEGLLENRCYGDRCQISNLWLNKPIVLHLDHTNGKKNDNRLVNLRFLCPNCHSQTETYGGKNVKKKIS